RPNPKQGRAAFIKNVLGFRRISGNTYIESIAPDTGPRRGVPLELWTHRPDRMKVIGGDGVQLVRGYEYTVGGSDPVRFEPSEILHWKFFDPLDDWYGLSPIAVAARSIDQSNESKRWNVNLLKNAGLPSGLFTTEQDLGEDFEEFRDEILAATTGPENAGLPIVADQGLDYVKMGLSPADMMWIEGQRMSADEIAISQGVAPELISGGAQKKYSNYGEARKALYLETVLPELDEFRDELNHWLVPRFGDGLYLDYDRDDIEALQEDRDKTYSRVSGAVKEGIMTRRQAAEELGVDTDGFGPEADVLTVTAATVPLEAAVSRTPAAAPTAATTPPGGDDGGDGDSTGGVTPGSPPSPEDDEQKALNLPSLEAKEVYWKSIELHRSNYYGTIGSLMQRRFRAEREAVLEAVNTSATAKGALGSVRDALAREAVEWRQVITATWFAVGEDFAMRTFQSFGGEVSAQAASGTSPDEVKAGPSEEEASAIWRRAIAVELSGILDERVGDGRGPQGVVGTTLEQLTTELQAGIDAGEGTDVIAKRLDTLYLEQIIPHRSEVIARTEVIAASNMGTRQGALATGLPLRKTWIGTFDSRIRDSHATAARTYDDDGAIGMDEPYRVGGSDLMYPGDPRGAAAEVVQCRCVEGYITA
ncbi:MAG TPA: phage portal protein, partial [Agromyces sp.]